MKLSLSRTRNRREPPDGRGAVLVALSLAGAFALQHCYDPAKAPPIDPSPDSTVSPEVRSAPKDASSDR